MSDKWIVFNESIPFLTEKEFYPVVTEQSDSFEIIDDKNDIIYIAKEESICDYEVFEKYPLPDNISYWKPATDNVTSPSHYNQGDIETIDYINQIVQAYNGRAGYHVGNVIKYVSRAPHKNGKEDLEKAKVYLEWAIEHFEG